MSMSKAPARSKKVIPKIPMSLVDKVFKENNFEKVGGLLVVVRLILGCMAFFKY